MRMRPTPSLWLAIISVATCVCAARAATRPVYGGTLLIEVQARLASFDPARQPSDPAQAALAAKLEWLIGDRLVSVDDRGGAEPSLATDWQATNDNKSWTLQLRDGIKFEDGRPLSADDVVRALAPLHPDWRVAAQGSAVRIDLPRPIPGLLLELALPENSILRTGANGAVLGTGAFRITALSADRISLAANEAGWQPRPFLDSVQILTGRTPRDQWVDFELGRADIVELTPDEVRRGLQSGARLWSSEPAELVALVFQAARAAAGDARVRQALAAAINRVPLRDVLLQKQGVVAESILPQWLSGYSFLFPAQTPAAAPKAGGLLPALSLGYDPADTLLARFAGRIAVDAHAAGLSVRLAPASPGTAATADVRLVRVRIGSLDPGEALAEMIAALGVGAEATEPASDSPNDLYRSEAALLASDYAIPLVDLTETYAIGPNVKDWQAPAVLLTGGWRLEDVWKGPE
jgi:peptide/nickel transport system substrate-binding protein